jgi:hypothetical protein
MSITAGKSLANIQPFQRRDQACCRFGKWFGASFGGGRLNSDGGALLLAHAERAVGIWDALAAFVADQRDPLRTIPRVADIFKARVLAINCGYEHADDLDGLRHDQAFRLALGKLVETGLVLARQPKLSRWENGPATVDIDDSRDVVHGDQQLSFWNGHYGERCFLPIHVYDTATGRPIAMLLRTGKTLTG